MTSWTEDLVAAAVSDVSDRYGRVQQLAHDPRGTGQEGEQLVDALVPLLRARHDLVRAWQQYSWDKRWSPSPYWESDRLEVGLFSGGYRDVKTHPDKETACAAFIVRELTWLRESHAG